MLKGLSCIEKPLSGREKPFRGGVKSLSGGEKWLRGREKSFSGGEKWLRGNVGPFFCASA